MGTDSRSPDESGRAMDALNWRKASYSAGNGGGCVETASTPSAVHIRDTQDRTGPVLRFTPSAWRQFADRVKRSLAPDSTLRKRNTDAPLWHIKG